MAMLRKNKSDSNVPDPANINSFRRKRSSSSFELLHRPRSQSVSCGSAFDAQAIASNDLRLWVLAAKNTKFGERRAKHKSKSLPAAAGSHQTFYPSSIVCTSTTTTMIQRCLLAFWSAYTYVCARWCWCLQGVLTASSHPTLHGLHQRPSTGGTCQWALEALTVDDNFSVFDLFCFYYWKQ